MESAVDDPLKISYKIFLDFFTIADKKVRGLLQLSFVAREPIKVLTLSYQGKVTDVKEADGHFHEGKELRLYFEQGRLSQQLLIAFESKIQQDPAGLFDRFTEDIVCVFCQGEPYGIESVFPCLNRPQIKSSFKFYARLPRYQKCYANGAKSRKVLDLKEWKQSGFWIPLRAFIEGLMTGFNFLGKVLCFRTIHKMPIHLFSVCVGNFLKYKQRLQVRQSNGADHTSVAVRVLVPESLLGQKGPYIEKPFFEVTKFSIEFYVKKFKIDFPYTKVDYVFADFGFGAMENPGLITVNKLNLALYEKESYLAVNRVRTITHELCHAYWGNMVSICGWRDIWVKEAFTEFWCHQSHYKFLKSATPDDQEARRVFSIYKFVKFFFLISDVVKNPHSIVPEVLNEANYYSHTVYYKGFKVLDVLSKFCGYKNFKAFSLYFLSKHKNESVSSGTLFYELDGFLESRADQLNSHLLSLIGPEDLPYLQGAESTVPLYLPIFENLKSFMFFSQKHLLLEIALSAKEALVRIKKLSEAFYPFYIELALFDRDFRLKATLKRIMGLHQGVQEISLSSIVPELRKDDYVLPLMQDSGYFFYLHDEATLDRLLTEGAITKIEDPTMRYYIYLFTKVLQLHLPSEKREAYISQASKLIESEDHPTFKYVKNSF